MMHFQVQKSGGGSRTRTGDILLAKRVGRPSRRFTDHDLDGTSGHQGASPCPSNCPSSNTPPCVLSGSALPPLFSSALSRHDTVSAMFAHGAGR